MAAPKKMKVTITFDNRTTRTLKLSYEDYMIVRAVIKEARSGNALQIDINDALSASYPELHSGTYQHIGQTDGPLWTAEDHPMIGCRVLNAEREFVRKWGASHD
jgi:hypothetical protein